MTDCRRIWRSERNEDGAPLQRRSSCVVSLGLSQLHNQGIEGGTGGWKDVRTPKRRAQHFFSVQGQYEPNTWSYMTFRSSAGRHLYEPTTQDHMWWESSQMPQWKDKDKNNMPPLHFLKPWHCVISQPWTQLWGRRWIWQRGRTVWIV